MKRPSFPMLACAAALQLLIASGSAHAAWIPDGNPICRVPESLGLPVSTSHISCPTGCTGAFTLYWGDGRGTAGAFSIYTSGLNDVIPPDPGPGDVPATLLRSVPQNCQPLAAMLVPRLPPDPNQFSAPATLLVWLESSVSTGQGRLRAQRLWDTTDWGPDGVVIADSLQSVQASIVPADSNGFIIAWSNSKASGTLDYIQRVDEHGQLRWGAKPILLGPDTTDQNLPRLAADGQGGAYVVRGARDSSIALPSRVYRNALYHFDRNGAPAPGWPAAGRRDIPVIGTRGTNSDLLGADLVQDGTGCWIVGWGANGRWVTRIASDGTYPSGWDGAGIPVATGWGNPVDLEQATLGASGDLLLLLNVSGTYLDQVDLIAQRIPRSGGTAPGWGPSGVLVCSAPGRQWQGRMFAQGDGLFCAWVDERSDAGDIYALRLLADGSQPLQWPANGMKLCGAAGPQYSPLLGQSMTGGALVAWRDGRDFANYWWDLYGTSVSADAQIGVSVREAAPRAFALSSVHPNPAHAQAAVQLELPADADVLLDVLDVAGRRVHEQRTHLAAGRQQLTWDLRRDGGERARPGLYLVRVRAGAQVAQTRVVVTE